MIRRRLVILFIVQIALVLSVSGIFIRFRLLDILEQELGAKLEAIAASIATQTDGSLVVLLGPGDEETRTYRALQQRLILIKNNTAMQRISIINPVGAIWLDTQALTRIGAMYLNQPFNRSEFRAVLSGATASSVLFQGVDQEWYKTGYAPLRLDERIIGIVAVEGSAESLQIVRKIQTSLLQIGAIALLFSFLLALLTSQRLAAPLFKLRQAAKKIGQGHLEDPVQVQGRDEIAFLARTMEDMRREVLQRDERQKAMLAGVAHEIRNPLGGIELFAGLLRDDLSDAEQKSRAERILSETQNLKTLVQSFLDFARPITVKKQRCNVMECFQHALLLVGDQIERGQIAVESDGDPSITVFVDPQHLKQVFLNLLLNSIQAVSPGGKIIFRMAIESSVARIEMNDTGTGIPLEARSKIFEPFFTTKEKGLGLGLAMVKMLLQKNNATIELKESSSFGAHFLITIPMQNDSG